MHLRLATGAAAAFLLALGLFGALARAGGGAPATRPPAALPDLPPRAAPASERLAALQATVRARPHDPTGLVMLAGAYAQRVRETGDASFYAKAATLLERALAVRPADPAALTERGALALSRHDFRSALRDAGAARRAAPDAAEPFGVLTDALIELGRYGRAGRVLQAMVDRKPGLAAYARVSYWRELHGDLAGARRAMALAASAGGETPEAGATVLALLSHLDLLRDRPAQAEREARAALLRFPGHPGATAALARAELARGRTAAAIGRLRPLVARLPLPEYVISLGEAELAAARGRSGAHAARLAAAGRRDLALVPAEQRLLAAAGVRTDTELAVFEADHGSPVRAVALARRGWRAAPSVRSADALGWALTRAGRPRAGLRWARRALRLGSADPVFLAHAGLAARAGRSRAEARRWLRAASASAALPPLLRREMGR
jgi:tetratricopeptide (TPR) repeat protein